MVCDCKNSKEMIVKMSVPTNQPTGNPPSGQYVPPAGTTGPKVGWSNITLDWTPATSGAALAATMLGSGALSAAAFGFVAKQTSDPVDENDIDEPELKPDAQALGPTSPSTEKCAPGPQLSGVFAVCSFTDMIPSKPRLVLCLISVLYT
eukprot:3308018-Rhodomonas_salina.1